MIAVILGVDPDKVALFEKVGVLRMQEALAPRLERMGSWKVNSVFT